MVTVWFLVENVPETCILPSFCMAKCHSYALSYKIEYFINFKN